MHQKRNQNWQQIVAQVVAEYHELPDAEKSWISHRLNRLEDLQRRLNRIFTKGCGPSTCGNCGGKCCALGHNHMTLANLLGFLQRAKQPPVPDFSRACPFLGRLGCLINVEHRPFNCITFVCDIIENSLTSMEVAEFYSLEQQLRSIYQEFAERFAGAGLTGLLLQHKRLAGGAFLARKVSRA